MVAGWMRFPLHPKQAMASHSTATEILCEPAEPEFRCRRGACARTLDRPIEGQAQHLDSERFRVGPRTSPVLSVLGWDAANRLHGMGRVSCQP
jgi:hypothetical protein